jgi:hypothetical protein
MEHEAFVDRVMQRMPNSAPRGFEFFSWAHGGRPTKEGFGIMPIPGVDPIKVVDAVMDVDDYVGNLDHVTICRKVPDDRFDGESEVRFYQKVNIPLLGSVHHELVLHRMGERDGYHIAAWHLLSTETDRLSPKEGFRSDYNHGAWIAAPGVLGYALSSAPNRKDVGFLKFKALTKGADAAASKVLQANLKGMAAWAARR